MKVYSEYIEIKTKKVFTPVCNYANKLFPKSEIAVSPSPKVIYETHCLVSVRNLYYLASHPKLFNPTGNPLGEFKQ